MNTQIKKYLSLLGLTMGLTSGAFAAEKSSEVAYELRQEPEAKKITDTDEASGFDVSVWERESLFLAPLTETYFADSGFNPMASWTGEGWGNMDGGQQRGVKWNMLLTFGFEQDFEKLTGVKNSGYFGVSMFYNLNTGKNKAYFDGLKSSPSNIFAGDMFRVFEIYYANSLETSAGTFSMRIGQLAADEDFMGLDYADAFLNSSFGAMPVNAGPTLYDGRTAFSQYANATFGATLAYQKEGFDAIFGLYNGDAGEDVSSNNGFDYDLEGIAFWYQFGYNYSLGGLKGRAQFGGNYHSGRFENFKTGGTSRNFYSFYWGLQQEILQDDEGNAKLGLFARIGYAPNDDISPETLYLEGGLNWFAPIPTRDSDIFALGVSSMKSGSASRAADPSITRYETCIEATYKIMITPAISLQPSFQVFLDPYNDRGNREACFVGGARLEIIF